MLDASTTARNAGLRSRIFGDWTGARRSRPGCPASSGVSAAAAATTSTSANTISQIRWPGAIASRIKPAPTLPAMKATEPHSRTGP